MSTAVNTRVAAVLGYGSVVVHIEVQGGGLTPDELERAAAHVTDAVMNGIASAPYLGTSLSTQSVIWGKKARQRA